MELQRMLDNGKWIDDDRAAHFIELAQAINPDAMSLLESGSEVKYDKNFWHAKIRMARPVVQKSVKAEEWILCDCGDVVRSNLVMNASRGTSCPDCYDAMSD